VRVGAALFVLTAALVACVPPPQSGGIVVLPGATERLLVAMRYGYLGAGDAKAPARVRRVESREDLPAGAAASARLGDWLLENGAVVAIVADVDGSPRGGQLVDLIHRRGGTDGLARVETLVGERRLRYTSAKSGNDDTTGSAYLQVTGHPEGEPGFEIVTRYDIAPELAGVVFHTSFKLGGHPPHGAVAVGDGLFFPEGTAKIVTGSRDVASFGREASYALEPLGETPFVVTATESGAALGLAPELVTTEAPEEPFTYSRMLSLLDRPDDVALATVRASAGGRAVGEVELEIVPVPRRVDNVIQGGSVLFQAAGAEPPLRMPLQGSLRAGDRHLARLPAGKYRVSFEGGGFRSSAPTAIDVAARVLTPVHVEARREAPSPEPPPPREEPAADVPHD
jgi:hypothetical protein